MLKLTQSACSKSTDSVSYYMLKDIGKIFTVHRGWPTWYKVIVMCALVFMLIYYKDAFPIYIWIAVPINYWILFGFNKKS